MNNTVNQAVNFKENGAYPINYNNQRYAPRTMGPSIDDLFISQQKAEKREKSRDRWNKAGIISQAGMTIGIFAMLGLSLLGAVKKGHGNPEEGKKLLESLKPVDVTKEKSFEQLTLGPEMKKVVADMKTRIERADVLKEKGNGMGSGIMLYGEPGGGKNAYVYALTKYMKEKFPGSELYEMNVLKLKDKWVGGTENNIMDFVENIEKEAKANPKKKLIVFMDEFDSIARKGDEHNKQLTESFQNAFKTTLTKLTSLENVQVIAATNKAEKNEALNKVLDEAILNRFPQKVYVPLPTKDQLKSAIVAHYKSIPEKYVDKGLTNIHNRALDKICADISKESHHASFRDLQYIFDHAKVISESEGRAVGSRITVQDLKAAVKKHAESENWAKNSKEEKAKKKGKEKAPGFWEVMKQVATYITSKK